MSSLLRLSYLRVTKLENEQTHRLPLTWVSSLYFLTLLLSQAASNSNNNLELISAVVTRQNQLEGQLINLHYWAGPLLSFEQLLPSASPVLAESWQRGVRPHHQLMLWISQEHFLHLCALEATPFHVILSSDWLSRSAGGVSNKCWHLVPLSDSDLMCPDRDSDFRIFHTVPQVMVACIWICEQLPCNIRGFAISCVTQYLKRNYSI